MRLYSSKFESTMSWMACSTFWSKVRRTFSRVLTRALASSPGSASSRSIIWPRVRRCSGPRLSPKRSFSSAMIRESASSSSACGLGSPWCSPGRATRPCAPGRYGRSLSAGSGRTPCRCSAVPPTVAPRGPPGGAVSLSEQVEIVRRPIWLIRPQAKEHGPLEHEPRLHAGDSQPIQEALETEAREEPLIVVAGLLGSVQQACRDGGRQISLLLVHAIASR
jgi:hypothetical protein